MNCQHKKSPTPNKPPIEIRLQVLGAINAVEGRTIRERIKRVSERVFTDFNTQLQYRFTWRTISTWLYRYKRNGLTTMENKTRADKHEHRKVQTNELAEAIHEVLPSLRVNKVGIIPKSTLYRVLIEKGFFRRSQLAPTTFYRRLRDNDLLDIQTSKKLRQSFAMQYVNELWQGDRRAWMH